MTADIFGLMFFIIKFEDDKKDKAKYCLNSRINTGLLRPKLYKNNVNKSFLYAYLHAP